MTTAVANVSSVRTLLSSDGVMSQIRAALPRHLTAERMLRVVMTAVQKTPRLLECSERSLIGAVVEASQLGLEPDGVRGLAYLIPRRNRKTGGYEAQLQIGYKGLIDLARRSGQIQTITAEVVYQKDAFRVVKGLHPDLVHEPAWNEPDPGPVIGAYAVAVLKDGGVQFHVMSTKEIEDIRKRSQSANDGPWVTDWNWMAKKTVVKQLTKLLPSSIELHSMVAVDDERDGAIDTTARAANIAPSTDLDALTHQLKAQDAPEPEPVEEPLPTEDIPESAPWEPDPEPEPTTVIACDDEAVSESVPPADPERLRRELTALIAQLAKVSRSTTRMVGDQLKARYGGRGSKDLTSEELQDAIAQLTAAIAELEAPNE